MFHNLVINVKNYTEFLSLNWAHIFIIILFAMATYFLKYNKWGLSKFVMNISPQFEQIIYGPLLTLFIVVNIIDTLLPSFYIIYFISILLYVSVSKCNIQTKMYLLLIFNICYFVSSHLNPFLSLQQNEVWVYVLVAVCLCILVLCSSISRTLLLFSFLLILNFFILAFSCVISSIDKSVIPLYVQILFTLGMAFFYVTMFLIYYFLTHFYFKTGFESFCAQLDCTSRVRIFMVSLSLVMLSLCIRNIYIYNVIVYQIFASIDLVILLPGTKNPHHEWMCGPGLKHLFGSHCRRMSTLLIYKQQHQEEMRQLYKELQELEKKLPKTGKTKTLWQEVELEIRRHRARHYGCLVTKDDGTKLVTFVTHSLMVDEQPTLAIDQSGKESSRITSIGFGVDEQYEKDVLPNISNMRETRTDELNVVLGNNFKEYNDDQLANKITMGNNEISSLTQLTTTDIPRYTNKIEQIKQQTNERNTEVD